VLLARRGNTLVVARADGTARRTIADVCFAGTASWSPDAERVAYYTGCDIGDRSIWVVGRDGRHRRRLTGLSSYDPRWSPDGGAVLFTSYANRRRGPANLFLMDPDGRHRRAVRRSVPGAENDDFNARWSRDGRAIFFWSGHDYRRRVYEMNRDGTGLRALTPPELGVDAYDVSPDGREVVVDGESTPRHFHIWVFPTAGGKGRRLTRTRGPDGSPAWSPDGRQIAFTSGYGNGVAIYVVNADGSGERRLTNGAFYDHDPSWVVPRHP
jgi:TolB protein